MVRQNIQDRERWKDLFEMKQSLKRLDKYMAELSGEVSEKDLKDVFNLLYELIQAGGVIVRDKKGHWAVESVDLSLTYLNDTVMQVLYNSLDETSKRFLHLDKLSNFNYSSYEQRIRIYKDWPKEGINFIDWLPIMSSYELFERLISDLTRLVSGYTFTKVAALESRGFLLGLPISQLLGVGFIPIRKKGKLPGKTLEASYSLEYGKDSVEFQEGLILPDDRVLIVDDLIATGGTISAANELVSHYTNSIIDLFFIELDHLEGWKKLKYPHKTLLHF